MPNPYADDEMKRRAQVGMLRDAPVSTTMPIGGAAQVMPVQPQRQTPSAGNRQQPPPPGWDAGNWSDPKMHSVKYDAGDLLYGATKPSDVGARVQSAPFQQRFPGATFDGKDNIDFKGALSDGDHGTPVGLIDVLMAADREGDTSNGIWWGAPDGTTPGAAAGQKPLGGMNPVMDNSAIARIMAELSAASHDDQSPAEREAVLQMLQGL